MATSQSKLDQLRRLADHPAEQVAHAARLVARERDPQVVLAALAALADHPDPVHRPLLRERYEHYEQRSGRRDQGGALRAAIARALASIATADDVPLLERAATTYEFLYGEAAGDLRAAGLLALYRVDDELAGYHAVRLLADEHTSIMSGEPAVTAARVLASLDQRLPLYAYLNQSPERQQGDVVAECLRHMTALPSRLLPPLVERYRATADEIVLLGLFDLLLGHASRDDYLGVLADFLSSTTLYPLYRWLVTTLLVSREATLVALVEAAAAGERQPARLAILREALAERRG